MAESKLKQVEKFQTDLKTCIECGNCTFWCPVYQELQEETYVARGKNLLIRRLLSGEVGYTKEVADVLEKCTLCMTCTEHCPMKCQVQSTIIAARADQVAAKGIGPLSKLVYRWLIPHRTLFGNVVRMASWFQVFLPRTEGKIRHLPLFLSAFGKGRQIPSIAPQFFRNLVPENSAPPAGVKTLKKVGYFIGCATDFVFPEIGRKTIDFLTRHGVEVVVPKGQGCCGTPVWSGAGDIETGRRLADVNVEVFAGVDEVLVDCATCASSLKEYPKFLADTPAREEAYKKFAGKIKTVSQFLVDELKLDSYQPTPEAKGKRMTWHDPCHANRYLKVKTQPRKILQSIPGVEYVEMVRADRCCGMAGSFSIHHYDLSKKIADRKAETIRDTGADIVVTACPGCMIQLIDTLKRNKAPQKVMHLMEVIQ